MLKPLLLGLLLAPVAAFPAAEGEQEAGRRANRLAGETSPYLQQHSKNPVDWYPWGPEALERARAEDKPIFLSIGYSACHWCHVMEHESFENESIAALMNEHFVCIKVDREERPDLDEIYMRSVQLLNNGRGGWPMSVFLTPELKPFFGGTYYPPEAAHGRPGFREILVELARAWRDERENVARAADEMVRRMRAEAQAKTAGNVDPKRLDDAYRALVSSYDATWGGFGRAPKFPRTVDMRLCLRHWLRTGDEHALAMATHTLDKMIWGGVYDQLGGAFHRYSTDAQWRIPHFEKMLYDNALLVPVLLEAYLATGGASGSPRYARVVRETCDWVLREMVTPEGGLASTQDADSEGEEGRFFAWTPKQLTEVLGEEHGRWAAAWWNVTAKGNFEHGKSALWRPKRPPEVAKELGIELAQLQQAMSTARTKLFAARDPRVHPMTDDKVLAAWNGMMISALAQAHQVLDEPRYLAAAQASAAYVLDDMRQESGRLFATARDGMAHLEAYLDDYAFMIQGLLDLYEADFDERWIREALALDTVLKEHFEDAEAGGFFTTADDHEKLLVRLKSPHDGALPSGNGVQAKNLFRLAELTGVASYRERAERTLSAFGAAITNSPRAYGALLVALDFAHAKPMQVVVAGLDDSPDVAAFLSEVRGRFQPARVVARAGPGADAELLPLLENRIGETARAYVCRDFVCKKPAATPEELAGQLE